MKRILLGILGVCACHAYAQTFKEWQDPEINAVNRAPMHTDFFAYESTELAAKGMKEPVSYTHLTLPTTPYV